MADDSEDSRQALALLRYTVISAYLALEPKRGQKRQLLAQLAGRIWTGRGGQPLTIAAETIRTWIRRYKRAGLAGLEDKERPQRGIKVLTPEQIELVTKLKRDVPERSLERIIQIAEEAKLIEPGLVRRSTLHRALKAQGLSARIKGPASVEDLDRFEAELPNDLWQSDMLVGPWLPDPERPGKMRRAYLYAFLDDHSRLLLHGRFSFKGELPALELVFRRSLQKYGLVRACYYDNGQVYRSGHMQQIVATLGIHPPHLHAEAAARGSRQDRGPQSPDSLGIPRRAEKLADLDAGCAQRGFPRVDGHAVQPPPARRDRRAAARPLAPRA
jgi:transposase